jgi:hypothetical protein
MKYLIHTILLSLLFFLSTLSFIVCKDEISGGDLSSVVFPSAGVHYSTVQDLFNLGCGGQSSVCHGPETFPDASFSLDSYEHVTYRIDIVYPGKPEASKIIAVIEGTSPPKMPPTNQRQLNDNQKKGLRTWVAEGARAD